MLRTPIQSWQTAREGNYDKIHLTPLQHPTLFMPSVHNQITIKTLKTTLIVLTLLTFAITLTLTRNRNPLHWHVMRWFDWWWCLYFCNHKPFEVLVPNCMENISIVIVHYIFMLWTTVCQIISILARQLGERLSFVHITCVHTPLQTTAIHLSLAASIWIILCLHFKTS